MDVRKATELTLSALTLKEKTLAKDLLYSEQYHKDTLSVKLFQHPHLSITKSKLGMDSSTGLEFETSFREGSSRGKPSGLQGSFLQPLL